VAGLDREAIIAEVARRHGILLGPEDPILATVAIHEVVFSAYIRQVEEAVARVTEEFEGATHRALEGSRTIARDILGQAIRQGREEVQKAVQPMVEELLRELHAALERQQALVERAEGIKRVVVTAAALTGLAVAALALLVAVGLG
jgi:F0F1-type ATP synthase membrane subunit b/b'